LEELKIELSQIANKPILIARHPVFCYNFSLMMQRQCGDGILVSFCVIAALSSTQNLIENWNHA